MSPQLFYSLSNVNGFNTLNGNTYLEHIVIILGEFIDEETKKKIKNSLTELEALELIPFPYTHSMEKYNKTLHQ